VPHEIHLRASPSAASGGGPRVAVVQDGARLHYAIPIALQRAGMLERVFCDWYAPPGSPLRLISAFIQRLKPDLGRRMLDRHNPALDSSRVLTHPLLTFKMRRARSRFSAEEAYWNWCSAQVAQWVERAGLGQSTALFGFIRNLDPALCRAARQAGLITVGDQIIAPYIIEREEQQRQRARFPGWEPDRGAGADKSAEAVTSVDRYEQETWDALDHITCASDYVRDGLVRLGIVSERISVLPYPLDVTHFPFVDRAQRTGPVTVGFTGAVGLRKGAPWFLEVARRFDPQRVRFVMVGPIALSDTGRAALAHCVQLVGAVPRSQILDWLNRFDLYFFPSTCEGSAGALMEAMATGLPIVASPNSGSICRPGIDGFIAPYDDPDALAAAIERLISDRDLRIAMGRAARESAVGRNLDQYAKEVALLYQRLERSRRC
jgi:hypothetical protein